MTNEEKQFVSSVVSFKENVYQTQGYIKEKFGVESEFDEQQSELKLLGNDNLSKAAANKFIRERLDESNLKVIF